MRPADAMGTFLKIWRSEWAKLSRAQLAMAVSAPLRKRKTVTPRMILHWEEGHPPNSTEELESLCRVMGRHGLTHLEVDQFRRSVFAACLDQHYPELFTPDDWTRREDIEAVALALQYQEWSGGPPLNRVRLVAMIADLGEALGEPACEVGRAQRRAQQGAMAYLQSSLRNTHVNAPRWRLAALASAKLVGFLDLHFDGGGPDRNLMSPENRAFEVFCLAHDTEDAQHVWSLLNIAQECLARGDARGSVAAYTLGMSMAPRIGTREQRDFGRQHAAPRTEACELECDAELAHAALFHAAVCDGLLDDARGHLEFLRCREKRSPTCHRSYWLQDLGIYLLAAGDRDEAARCFEEALEYHRRIGDAVGEADLADLREACESPGQAIPGHTGQM